MYRDHRAFAAIWARSRRCSGVTPHHWGRSVCAARS
jgi:hypothetical protein